VPTISFWIGVLVLVSGVAALGRGRNWHDEAEGPRFPSERLGSVAGLLRNGVGPIAVAALPIQLFGLVAVVVGILMMFGVVPSQQAPGLAVAELFGLVAVVVGILMMFGVVPSQQAPGLAVAAVAGGIFLVTLATLLIRLVVWFSHRNRAG